MYNLKEPKFKDGNIDLEWWNSLSIEERSEYEVWESQIKFHPTNMKREHHPLEVILKPELIDTSVLKEDSHKALWRPEVFDEYIGQEKLKNILKGYISGCKKRNKPFPHMLIDGKAGNGKTTIAYIVAKQLNLKFVECVATVIQSQQQFIDLLTEVDGGILFIDEIHMIKKTVANFILPILEDFQVSGRKIKPFTLMGCTTEKGILLKTLKPLVDRMKIQKTLDDYTTEELNTLVKQFKNKSFSDIEVNSSVLEKIAQNCRLTPRIAIRYLESFVYMEQDIEEIFQHYDIVKEGITSQDIKVLQLLNSRSSGIGLKSICAYLGTSEQNYLYQIEGYLLQRGFITINARREITPQGKEFLECLKNKFQ